ncbi:hypothetical protein PanWU01x14_015250 [Parasponia andersonii]|uniref:Uncharacterized protein n=1 Tax=Parasponia andersonii TaxID=3476 RepID=A0A2P5E0F6_PARAD|nr:hypothetical protein PanWU01x14_015250 [Parasponia andersonii]
MTRFASVCVTVHLGSFSEPQATFDRFLQMTSLHSSFASFAQTKSASASTRYRSDRTPQPHNPSSTRNLPLDLLYSAAASTPRSRPVALSWRKNDSPVSNSRPLSL